METELSRNIKLGLFVAVATLLLIVALYFIGERKNIFSTTFRVTAEFSNVNGLLVGDNVRFAGIIVGTVKNIEVESDSTVKVSMVIEEKIRKNIKKNAVA